MTDAICRPREELFPFRALQGRHVELEVRHAARLRAEPLEVGDKQVHHAATLPRGRVPPSEQSALQLQFGEVRASVLSGPLLLGGDELPGLGTQIFVNLFVLVIMCQDTQYPLKGTLLFEGQLQYEKFSMQYKRHASLRVNCLNFSVPYANTGRI